MIWSIFSSANDYPLVDVSDSDGFVDLTFKIIEVKNDREFLVKGKLGGVKVGFAIKLHQAWKPQAIEDIEEPFYWGEADFKSIGADSKAFIGALAKLYVLRLLILRLLSKYLLGWLGWLAIPARLKKNHVKRNSSLVLMVRKTSIQRYLLT